jgi:DNA-binding response OmpR family regulator
MEPSPHILVVDDSADIREPLAKYLTRKGSASRRRRGVEMRKLLKSSAFDLVVSTS